MTEIGPDRHVGYVVDDLENAAQQLAATVGAGPFLHIGHVPLATATYRGHPAHYDHSTAFGAWGPILIEISQIHAAEPAGLREFMTPAARPAIGHLGWLVDDLDTAGAELERNGSELVHAGGSGPVQARWHDASSVLGHPVEILRRCPEIEGFYAAIHAAARGWDGSRPLRDAPGPPPPS